MPRVAMFHPAAFALCAALLLALPGCTVRTAPEPPKDPAAGQAGAPSLIAEGPDIGDVEHGLRIDLNIPEGQRPDGVAVEELRDYTKALNLATVTVAAPGPAQLPVFVTLDPRFNVGQRLVVLRGTVLRDDAPISQFHVLIAPEGPRLLHVDGAPVPGLAFSTDALAGLPAPPETLLLHVETQAFLLPADADPDTVDPATATAVPTATTTVLSNPLRINWSAPADAA